VHLLGLGPFVEVSGAMVGVEGSMLQHVIGCRQDRSGKPAPAQAGGTFFAPRRARTR
jgi:hypothetical protein